MKGYTIQHSIDLLEDSVEDLEARPSGGGTAADISYDNTTSHLTADDVQEAIDELVADMPTLNDYGIKYSATEHQVGYGLTGEPIYQKTVNFGALPNAATKKTAHSIDNLAIVYGIEAVAYHIGDSSSIFLPIPQGVSQSSAAGTISLSIDLSDVTITAGTNVSTYDNCYVTITYSKTPANNTRSKKSKRRNNK